MSKIDWDDPKYLVGRLEKVATPPDEATREAILKGAMERVHRIVNNAVRACGVDCDGRRSELTHELLVELFERISTFVERRLQEDSKS